MLKSSNKIETNKYELEIAIDAETFCDAIKAVYKKEAKNIAIKGFRKGKAPLHMVEKLYGEGVFFDDALNMLYEGELLGAVDAAGLVLVDVEPILLGQMAGKERADHLAAIHTDNGVDGGDIAVTLGKGDCCFTGHHMLMLHAGDIQKIAVMRMAGGEMAGICGNLQFGAEFGCDDLCVHIAYLLLMGMLTFLPLSI